MYWSKSFSSFYQVTYTSDYFEELYDLAVKLIHKGLAYVDHQSPEEVKEYREKKMNSPWRDRPIAESLKLFEDMRQGFIDEGKATLRLKQDMQNHNKNMYDLIAYRIKVEEIEGEPRTAPLSNGEAVVRFFIVFFAEGRRCLWPENLETTPRMRRTSRGDDFFATVFSLLPYPRLRFMDSFTSDFPLSSSDSTIVSGYFAVDPDSTPSKLVLNRTTTLRDSYCKGAQK
ncbi:hypothetical protein B296_00028294 [Ensete ventricosum]|uniref:Glutamyl/glutaminyl-tRNA synthetase class Ib catalytic domain-containing protein n=1 Tax=Ensete ventricosum TaxID=4639 RepID=A0A427AN86_ENSVE|nr:hypothetical protein B296_00028294 [Ensete ventricosum]